MTAMLAVREKERLDICEQRIKRGLATFVDVGRALAEIRDGRLYREMHGTFEEYCQERWGLKRQRAYELMQAASVVSEISDNPPARESHAAELARVPEEDRADVWRQANERTNGKPTAAAIRDVHEERHPQPPRARELPQAPTHQPDEPAVEESGVPAPSDQPSEAVTDFLDSDEDLRRERYLHSFLKVLARSDDFMQFEAEKVGELADADVARSLDDYLTNVRAFVEKFHRARRGLTVIQGGQQ